MKLDSKIVCIVISCVIISFYACSKDNDSDEQINSNSPKEEQYTPNQADWSTFQSKPFKVSSNTSHAPDGVGWLSKESWEKAKWDGTIYNPTKKSSKEFYDCMCPSVDQVRGIREVFYKHKPFADNKNPTKAEVDEWHRVAINHVRALVGYIEEERQIKKNHFLFARALWSDQRANTNMWDAKYPGNNGSAYGPCNSGHSNPHCGDGFVPDATDQIPYLPKGYVKDIKGSTAGGIFSSSKADIPWSIKWSRSFCVALKQEGFWGGHVGPWFHREKFGFSFWDSAPNNQNSIAVLRAKWGGKLMNNKYKKP